MNNNCCTKLLEISSAINFVIYIYTKKCIKNQFAITKRKNVIKNHVKLFVTYANCSNNKKLPAAIKK